MVNSFSENLYDSLQQLTQSLKFSDRGKIRPFLWNTTEYAEFTTKKLLMYNTIWGNQSLKLMDKNKFLAERSGFANYNIKSLIDILQRKINQIQYYRGYFPDEGFDIYIGKTDENIWFGLLTPFDYSKHIIRKRFKIGSSDQLKSKINLEQNNAIQQLRSLLDENGFSQNKRFFSEIGETEAIVIEKLLEPSKFLIVQSFEGIYNLALQFDPKLRNIEEERNYYVTDDFYLDPGTGIEFELDSVSPESLPEYPSEKNYQNLDVFLQSNLSNIKIYAVGATATKEFNIYILGSTPNKKLVGVLINVNMIV